MPLPKKTEQVIVKLTKKEKKTLATIATRRGKTMSDFIRELLARQK